MKLDDYEKYYQKGGSYVIPVEIFNELFNDYECFKNDYQKYKEVLDKAVNDIQEIIDAVNKNTIIAMKQFNFKLEIIQDELSGSNDILNEVSE